jgi:hypothetical protein
MSSNLGDSDRRTAQIELSKVLMPQRRHIMKRCFMTGKQCIFSAYITEYQNNIKQTKESKSLPDQVDPVGAQHQPRDDLSSVNVFTIMPFTPHLETFYRWSLSPYLIEGYEIPERNVRRADEVRDVGYIVCEKICRMIQEADLVVADISINNSNVFYEIGLTFGLERPFALIRANRADDEVVVDPRIRQSLNMTNSKDQKDPILLYPGVGALDLRIEDHRLHKYVQRPPTIHPSARYLRISILKIPANSSHDNQQSSVKSSIVTISGGKQDIPLDFTDVLKGGVGVAMAEIRSDVKESKLGNEPWVQVVKQIDDVNWFQFSQAITVEVNGKGGFDAVAASLESSFATIIDVSNSDPVAYFWLGYCHARGLNAIPVFRTESGSCKEDISQTAEKAERLAFDIHALWYAEYDESKPYEFKTKIREIIEHLLQRDLPDRQKRAFWDRFPAEKKIKVFTGAIHISDLNREMIGDWDLRTVSELFSYLPAVREAMAIELVTPIYSPEQAYKRYSKTSNAELIMQKTNGKEMSEVFLAEYRQHISDQLKGVNAIVIASPDVNPITEYLLHATYAVGRPTEAFDQAKSPSFEGFVVVKQLMDSASKKHAVESPRLFYTEAKAEDFAGAFPNPEEIKNLRGFGVHAQTKLFMEDPNLFQEYFSQDECKDEFFLLGQLVIARYPKTKEGNLIVLLNGVSGPATFALAQILTGGGVRASHEMNAKSEKLLERINKLLDNPNCLGVEAIVKVKIVPAEGWEKQTYLDSRQVKGWDFLVTCLDDQPDNLGKYGPREIRT